jgi:hypothetical protein
MATAMVSRGVRWSYFYLITLALAVVAAVAMGWSFRGYEQDSAIQLLTSLERTASRQAISSGEPTKFQVMKQALRMKTTYLAALFILLVSLPFWRSKLRCYQCVPRRRGCNLWLGHLLLDPLS